MILHSFPSDNFPVMQWNAYLCIGRNCTTVDYTTGIVTSIFKSDHIRFRHRGISCEQSLFEICKPWKLYWKYFWLSFCNSGKCIQYAAYSCAREARRLTYQNTYHHIHHKTDQWLCASCQYNARYGLSIIKYLWWKSIWALFAFFNGNSDTVKFTQKFYVTQTNNNDN